MLEARNYGHVHLCRLGSQNKTKQNMNLLNMVISDEMGSKIPQVQLHDIGKTEFLVGTGSSDRLRRVWSHPDGRACAPMGSRQLNRAKAEERMRQERRRSGERLWRRGEKSSLAFSAPFYPPVILHDTA